MDDAGRPIEGVTFRFRVEAYPKDWTFETRERDFDVKNVTVKSDAHGLIEFTENASKLILLESTIPEYRELFETRLSSEVGNRFYGIVTFGDLWYKSDPDNPAVYVFVRDGVKEVSALPSRGGFDSGGGTVWRRNEPAWPKKPSLPDVVYKPATTQPATTQAGS